MRVLIVVVVIAVAVTFILLLGDSRSDKERRDEAEKTMKKGLSEAGLSEEENEKLPWKKSSSENKWGKMT